MLERVTCYFLFHFRWAPAKDYGFLYGGLQPVVLSRPSRSYIIARPSEHELMFHSIYPLRSVSKRHFCIVRICHIEIPRMFDPRHSWYFLSIYTNYCSQNPSIDSASYVKRQFSLYLDGLIHSFLHAETFHRLGILCQTTIFSLSR